MPIEQFRTNTMQYKNMQNKRYFVGQDNYVISMLLSVKI